MNWYLWALSNKLEHHKRHPLLIEWWLILWRSFLNDMTECVIFFMHQIFQPSVRFMIYIIPASINTIWDMRYVILIMILMGIILLV